MNVAVIALLLTLSTFAFLGGIVGLVDYVWNIVPNWGLQRPIYPEGMQLLRWLIGLSTGGVFVLGYLMRWPNTPMAMVVVLTALGTLCAIETFGFLMTPMNYAVFGVECIAYVAASRFIFVSDPMRRRFEQPLTTHGE